MKYNTEKISIVSPCYNESQVIKEFYRQLTEVLETIGDIDYEIIFIDDGSTDDTVEQLRQLSEKDSKVQVCCLSRNFGHQVALTAGLDIASGDAVILMDSDLQHPPEMILSFVDKWKEGYEIVSSVRKKTEGASFFKNFSSGSFYWMINKLSDTVIKSGVADFCLITRNVCDSLCSMRERHRFLRGMISWLGYKRTFISYHAPKRTLGYSKYTTVKMISLAMDAIYSFSSAPLKMATRLGLLVVISGAGYLFWIIGRYFLLNDLVQGWASLISVVLIIGGCQLFFIGLIGQYLARIFDEVKGRPIYLVKKHYGKSSSNRPCNERENDTDE